MPLSPDQLDPAYRASLRRLAQARAHAEWLEKRLLREKARHLRAAQQIDEDLEVLHRRMQDEQAGYEIAAMHESGTTPTGTT